MPKRTQEQGKVSLDIDTSLSYRAMAIVTAPGGGPASLDEATRSVEMVCASETPVLEIDWDRWEMVPTVLRMDGMQMPGNKQLPLLDTHMRSSTACIIGSVRELRVVGTELFGRAIFSTAPEAEGPYLKTMEGHLTDSSIARRDLESTYIPEGQKQKIGGTEYTGPIKVVTRWVPKEQSMCPIGADEMAKVRAATAPPVIHKQRKEQEMDEKIKAFLVSRGLPETATDEEALAFMQTLDVRSETQETTTGTVDTGAVTDQVRTAFIAEQNRCSEIKAICRKANLTDEQAMKYITDGAGVEAVRKAAFDHVLANPPAGEQVGFRTAVEMGADARDKFRAAAEGSLILRAGLMHDPAKLAPGATELRGYSLRELSRECLRAAGLSIGGDPMEMVGRALTSSDLPTLLGTVANLSLLAGWETAQETWETWADGTGSVSDFKTQTLARAGETDDLDEIGEDDEYKYGSLAERAESFKLATYGKLNKISRQGIINDELGAITSAFATRGEAAARKVGDLVYAVLTANAAMGDGTALFHANHSNLLTGAAIGVDAVGAAVVAMGLQKDIGGKRRLNIKPQYLVAPLTLQPTAETFFTSPVIGTQASPAQQNIYGGNFLTRVYEPRLDDNSTKAWYLAGPKGKTVKVFFLNGNRTPYLETKQGWNIDGVEFKTRIDACAKALSWKGLAKNPGP